MLGAVVEELGPDQATSWTDMEVFATKAELSAADAQKIVTQMLALHGLRTTLGLTADDFYEKLTESLLADTSEEWQAKNLGNWRKSKNNLVDAFSPNHPFHIIEKRTRLTYEHQNVMYDAGIVTDVRPVFDDTGLNIEQLSIHHVISIEYFNGTQRNQLFAALDSADVARLKKACERAQTKEATLKKKLKGFNGPVVTAGEVDDE